jgi:hypothetical protein
LKTESSWKQFYGTDPPFVKNVHQFGKVAIVEEWASRGMRSKLDNCGKSLLYLGPTKHHSSYIYCFLNLSTKRTICSRNVTWLNDCNGNVIQGLDANDDIGPECAAIFQEVEQSSTSIGNGTEQLWTMCF